MDNKLFTPINPSPKEDNTIQLKKLMRALETQNGTLNDHAPMEKGIHKDTVAIGNYGLMPITLDELADRDRTQLDKFMKTLSPYQKEVVIKENPDIEDKYASQLATHVLNKTNNDIDASASGWLYGHNLSKQKMLNKLENDPEYQQRIDDAVGSSHLQSSYLDQILARAPKLYKLQSEFNKSVPINSDILNDPKLSQKEILKREAAAKAEAEAKKIPLTLP